jgi:hypothetical protein
MYKAGYARRRPGWKPKLSPDVENRRYLWALITTLINTRIAIIKALIFAMLHTQIRRLCVGEQRGMQRSWFKNGERYEEDVKKDHVQKHSKLQFYRVFTYDYKGPCVIYERETPAEEVLNNAELDAENADRRARISSAQTRYKWKLHYKEVAIYTKR